MDRFFKTSSPDWYVLLKENARKNREKPTEAEYVLWQYLRNKQLGVKFLRQHVVLDYIADFICLEKLLIVEVDGGYHQELEQKFHDEERTIRLESKGYKIIRYTNEQVLMDTEKVIENIKEHLN
ncbi:MAG: endonuclease domain-containing protein [Bacteroidaceae bacterium]|nr:endonuclease domain-containing protein [Bacteroidaceae bacterium]